MLSSLFRLFSKNHRRYFAYKNTYLMIDNTSPHKSYGIGPYIAVNKSVKEGYLRFLEYFEYDTEAFCLLQYSYDYNEIDYEIVDKKKGTIKIDTHEGNPIDYFHIEWKVPEWRLTHLCDILHDMMKKTRLQNNEKKIIENHKINLQRIIKEYFIPNQIQLDKKWTLPALEKVGLTYPKNLLV